MGSNPFRPRAGRTPPVLAGRDDELDALLRAGRRLARGEDGDERVLVAPRGYGKTALLNTFEDALKASGGWTGGATKEPDGRSGGARPRIVSITAADMETVDDLLITLSSPETGRATRLVGGGFSIAGFGGGSVNRDVQVNALTATRHLLSAHPTVLIVDEGSALRPTPARALLNAVQSVNRRSARVLLVIAGTPETEYALNRAHASFWDKAKKTRLDLLDAPVAEEAIAVPLADRGIRLSATAMDHVMDAAHGYPFFLQVWGAGLFDHAADSGLSVLDERHVEAARPVFEQEREELYSQRVGELDSAGRAAALGVARAFLAAGEGGNLSWSEIASAIRAGWDELNVGPSDVDAAYRDLKRRGFFWRPDARRTAGYQRGIPSLMDYAAHVIGGASPSRPPAGSGR